MPIIDYSQDPDSGAYTFHKDDGTSMPFADSPASRDLASWVDQRRQGPDERLARNAMSAMAERQGAPNTAPVLNETAQPEAPEQRADVSTPLIREPVRTGTTTVEHVEPRAAEQPHGGAEPGGSPSPSAQAPGGMSQEAIAKYLSAPEVHPGRAAVDPAAIRAASAPVPVSQVTSGGMDLSPEDAERKKQDLAIERLQREADLQEARAGLTKSAELYATQTDEAQKQYEEKTKAIAEQQARQASFDRYWQPIIAKKQQDVDAIAQGKVDPGRMFHGTGGTIAAIVNTLAMGLGAFGASLGGGQNYALQIVQKSIEQDIDAQKDELDRKGLAANNALARVMKQYQVDKDDGAAMLKSLQNEQVIAQTRRTAAQVGGAQAPIEAAKIIGALQAQNAQLDAQTYESAFGKHTMQEQFIQKRAATPGYISGPSESTVAKRIANVGGIQRLQGGTPEQQMEQRKLELEQQRVEIEREKANKAAGGKQPLTVTLGASVGTDDSPSNPGRQFTVAPEDRAKAAAAMRSDTALARMEAIAHQSGSAWTPSTRNDFEQAAFDAANAYREMEGLPARGGFKALEDTPLAGIELHRVIPESTTSLSKINAVRKSIHQNVAGMAQNAKSGGSGSAAVPEPAHGEGEGEEEK